MKKIAEFIVKYRIAFVILFVALVTYSVICIPRVEVEYDISAYLPENTDTKKAIEIMNDEFETYGTATVMVKNIEYADALALHDAISEIDGVKRFDFSDSETYYKNNNAKFSVTFDGGKTDERAVKAYKATLAALDKSGYSYVVPSPLDNNYADTLASEMVVIVAIAAAVILFVLLFTSKSFAEVLAFPVVFVVAAALNMGTNYWLGKISFVSNTVCIILQLALAIDYAIILCHRFTEEKDALPGEPLKAMTVALTKAIPEIASSSLTTISGLVALMFMQLGLGFDLGIVLAKSIVCSLLTVFLLMPALLIALSKLMDKSRHRNFVPKLRFFGKAMIKARYVLIPVFVALFAVGAALSQRIDYVYSTESIATSDPTPAVAAKHECEAVFGHENAFVVLVKQGDVQKERRITEKVKELGDYPNLVTSALGMASIEYNGYYLIDNINADGFAEVSGVGSSMSELLLRLYAASEGDAYSPDYAAPLIDVLDFVVAQKDMLPISAELKSKLDEVSALLEYAKSQLVGKNYSRIVFNLDAGVEDAETFEFIKKLSPEIKKIDGDAIFAGSSMSAYDLNSSFSSDNILITVLTVAFIYLILAFTFRSWGIPVILVLVIQGAIFLNFSIPFITGGNLFFFTYLIISAIQMGATIDYAILLTNRFGNLKARLSRREAMTEAVSGVFPTVFTSGTIMCVAGFLVGALTSDPLIASIGTYIGTGTVISIISVLTFLPALLYALDPILEKTVIKPRHPMKKLRLPNPSLPPSLCGDRSGRKSGKKGGK